MLFSKDNKFHIMKNSRTFSKLTLKSIKTKYYLGLIYPVAAMAAYFVKEFTWNYVWSLL